MRPGWRRSRMCGYLGQLLQRLENDGLARNTVVVLSSDHGPLFRGKQFLYDGGMRIPLIVRFPDGRPAGAMDRAFVLERLQPNSTSLIVRGHLD